MPSRFFVTIGLVVFVVAGSYAHADFAACVADDIIAADAGCPASGDCSITENFIVASGCVLDFGTRNVTVESGGKLVTGAGQVTLRAGDFTVAPGGSVDGRTNDVGTSFAVEATGDISIEKTGTGSANIGKIRVSGKTEGGILVLNAQGDINVSGQLHSNNRDVGAAVGAGTAVAGGIGVVSAAGTAAGLSASGIMSGLATVGGVVGSGAVAGIGALGLAPAVASAGAMQFVLRDDPILHETEREARRGGRRASVVGAVGGSATAIGGVAAMGAVSGVSAAGITSGLAAVGSLVGGGMVAGVAVTAALPAVAAAGAGYGVYRLGKWLRRRS